MWWQAGRKSQAPVRQQKETRMNHGRESRWWWQVVAGRKVCGIIFFRWQVAVCSSGVCPEAGMLCPEAEWQAGVW